MPKTLKLISLGARGVGKTVFLVSNCADALFSKQTKKQDFQWFECRDQNTKESVEKILSFVNQNQKYPPATFKLSNFNLSLKQTSMGNVKTLCDLEWIDIPGEWCTLENQDFQSALLESHGCCVFVDADALLNNENYSKSLQQTIQQVEAIESLINQHNVIQYPIALVCTKYDLIHSNSIGLIKLEEKLRPLIQKIKSSQNLYKQFYSAIPLSKQQGRGLIQKTNANNALFWMTTELARIHPEHETKSLGQVLNSLVQDKDISDRSTPLRRKLDFSNPRQVILMVLVACGVISAFAALSLLLISKPKPEGSAGISERIDGFKKVLQTDPTNESAILGIVDSYSKLGAYDDAIMELQALHEREPNDTSILESLVLLYDVTGQTAKQEEHYDKILTLEKNNFTALVGKAQLKAQNGDKKEALDILKTAINNAKNPTFKAELERISQQILNSK